MQRPKYNVLQYVHLCILFKSPSYFFRNSWLNDKSFSRSCDEIIGKMLRRLKSPTETLTKVDRTTVKNILVKAAFLLNFDWFIKTGFKAKSTSYATWDLTYALHASLAVPQKTLEIISFATVLRQLVFKAMASDFHLVTYSPHAIESFKFYECAPSFCNGRILKLILNHCIFVLNVLLCNCFAANF